MSTLVVDGDLLDDMARTLAVVRPWAIVIAEQHEGMDTSVIDGLLERYRGETGRDAVADVSGSR